jgi:hypothetical protein
MVTLADIHYAPVSLRDKALAFRKDAVALRRGKMVPPTMAIVYPTYFCNMRCFGCVANAENAKTPVSISVPLFRNFVTEFSVLGGESIEFSGGGEPTLHPHFGELVEAIAEEGLQFGMITNGTRPETLGSVFRYDGTRYIRVSVYTVNQLESLRDIVRCRENAQSRASVGGKILLGISDIPLLEYLVEEILATGVDFVSVKAKRHCADDPQLLSQEALQSVTDKLAALSTKHAGKVFGNIQKTHQKGLCWLNPLHTVVDAVGTVWICCYYQDREEDISIGSLIENKFIQLWYGPEHTAAMSRVQTHECNFYDCRFSVYNDVLNEELSRPSDMAFI